MLLAVNHHGMQNYLSSKTNLLLMSPNIELVRNLYPEFFPEPPAMIWVKLIIVLALFLIMPYLYVRFVEWRFKSFLGKIWHRISFEFGRKFQWMRL